MGHLSLVKSLSRLKEEHQHSEEILLETFGLTFTRGTITEITGESSAGKTSLSLVLLAKLTAVGEICAMVDSSNSFDPRTASLAGLTLENLLWIKCGGNIEKAFTAANYLVQAKGFGAIWLNLNGISSRELSLLPKSYWFRYRTHLKETQTVFLVTAAQPLTGSSSQQALVFSREKAVWSGTGRFKLLRNFHLKSHSRKELGRQPVFTKIEFDYTDA